MKKTLIILLIIVLLVGVIYSIWANGSGEPVDTRDVQQLAGKAWIGTVDGEWQSFVAAPGFAAKRIKTVALVPMAGDKDGYLTAALQKAFASQGVELVTRDPAELNLLQKEIDDWSDEVNLKVDPATVQKLGKGLGVDGFIIGKVFEWDTNLAGIRSRCRASVSLVDTETGGIPWTSGVTDSHAYIHWSDFLTHFWEYPVMLSVITFIILLLILSLIAVIWRGFLRTMKAM